VSDRPASSPSGLAAVVGRLRGALTPKDAKLKTVNLALQGGGAHGAFPWGVLDRLIEDGRLDVEAISGTSAGAMNAVALVDGLKRGGRDGAREQLAKFWQGISRDRGGLGEADDILNRLFGFWHMPSLSPFAYFQQVSGLVSPYGYNPLNINPLQELVEKLIDFDSVRASGQPRLFISATNVRNGKVKVFTGREVTAKALLASAALPSLFQAVEIGEEAYWDGGYMGNPALFPLFYETESSDIIIVHINPIERNEVPTTARSILNRINEISFNSSLLRELRSIDFVHRLLDSGAVERGTMKDIHIHSIMDDELMTQLGVATKVTPDEILLLRLFEAGREQMDTFLADHRDDLGERSSVNLRALFQ
jgi:NTE family protein